MTKDRSIEILDVLVLIVRFKKYLLLLGVLLLVFSYLLIYFFIPPEYKATATILPSQESNLGAFSAIAQELSNLPLGIGGMANNGDMGLYTTVIYSRSTVDSVINKFNLMKVYNFDSREKAVKAIRKKIKADVTTENAYDISVYSRTPQMASDITNYIVSLLNESIIRLNVSKAKDNRLFLQQRYKEIKQNLHASEDSLKNYQQRTGVLEAEEQIKQSIDAFVSFEAELAEKQIQYSITQHLMGENAPQSKSAKISAEIFKNKVDSLEKFGGSSGLVLSIKSLPARALNYFRYYRDVKIYEKMLEYVIPLYEQAKFDERKDTPILQVVDYAIPPEKKAFPPRILLSIAVTFVIMLMIIGVLLSKEIISTTENPKINYIKNQIFNFKKIKQ